jgi:hypothetical protein
MKTTLRTVFVLAALLFCLSAFAQDDVYNRDFGIGPSGGPGGSCFVCDDYASNNCDTIFSDPGVVADDGYLMPGVVAHYAFSGCTPGAPGTYCKVTGECHVYVWASNTPHLSPDDLVAEGIREFLLSHTAHDITDFIARTEFDLRVYPYAIAAAKRAEFYRIEFNRLEGRDDPRRELKPGEIPVAPLHRLRASRSSPS